MALWKKIVIAVVGTLLVLAVLVFLLARKPVPEEITYGMSFNAPYATELGLDWRETYDAILDELGVRHLRLAAHWDAVEPQRDQYDFSSLDYQLDRAEEVGAQVIFAVGRRLPRWPECHVPQWVGNMSWDEQKDELRDYIEAVVTRYRDRPSITHWQVENEPYLALFAEEHCGELDEDFLREEIELVRSLDNTRPILVTDSGNLGTWHRPYRLGDSFGTSVYVYFWNPELGQFRTVLAPWFYRLKEGIVQLFYGPKETFLIELSAEPWLVEPIIDVPIEVQFERMDPEKFAYILDYARNTRYERQYLWGAEWWYWLRMHGEMEMWDMALPLFDR